MDRQEYLQLRKELRTPIRPAALLIHGLQDLALAGFAILSWQAGGEWKLVTAPVMSVLIFRHFSLMHEAVHGLISKKKPLNDFVGVIAGAVSFLPFEPWKKSHLEHHFWSGNVEKDPVMQLHIVYPAMKSSKRGFLSAIWKTWFPILALLQYGVFWLLCFGTYAKNPRSGKLLASVLAPFALWGALGVLSPEGFVLEAILPALLIYWVMVEVVNLPHHAHLTKFQGDTKLPVWEQYATARTCLYPKWAARFVVLNFNYHSEHHVFPDVPWYHLEQAHQLLHARLKDKQHTDPYFEWILKNKKRHLDDVITLVPDSETKKAA